MEMEQKMEQMMACLMGEMKVMQGKKWTQLRQK
jgi:hypothetical protein